MVAVQRSPRATVRTGSIELPGSTLVPSTPAPGPASVATPTPVPTPAPIPTPTQALASAPSSVASRPAAPIATASAPAGASTAPTPGFDLGRLAASSPVTTPAPATAGPPPDSVSLEKIFADLGAPSAAPAPVAGAVDIRSIVRAKDLPAREPELVKPDTPQPGATKAGAMKVAKGKAEAAKLAAEKGKPAGKKGADPKLAALDEVDGDALAETKAGAKGKKADLAKADAKKADAKKADAKKADAKNAEVKKAPSHPSRIWVQIGVGRDPAAISFDWRRFTKASPALFKGRRASTSDMGRTNRILVGPFESQKAASAFVAQAKKADVGGAFIWTSPAGQVVDPLAAK